MKPIRLRIFARVDTTGHQVLSYVIYSRKRQRKWGLYLILDSDPRFARSMVADALKRLRNGWRQELLGEGWQQHSAMRRRALREAEFRARYPRMVPEG